MLAMLRMRMGAYRVRVRVRVRVLVALALAFAFALAPSRASAEDARKENVAFTFTTAVFYGADLPWELFAHYDRVVIEPDHFETMPASPRAELFAYVSMGEVHQSRPYYLDIPPGLFAGRNRAWQSDIIDTKNPAWGPFVLDHIVEPLWRKGYRGFFFDTLDSYKRLGQSPADDDRHARAIAAILTTLVQRHPEAKILLNRGFDVLPHVPKIDGLVVESLFATCDATGKTCSAVPEGESKALLARLQEVRRKRAKLPITVIDYVPSIDVAARRAVAKKIAALDFDPYITSPKLDEIGLGRVEIVPRRILVVYKHNDEGYLGVQDACVLIAPILEWLGYAVDYADVRQPLPKQSLAGRYAGIVTLLPEGVDKPAAYKTWLLAQIDAGIKVAFVEGFGFDPDPPFLSRLGLAPAKLVAKPPMKIVKSLPGYFGFEAPVRARIRDRPTVVSKAFDVTELLRIEDADGAAWSGAVLGPWGGAAFIPYVIEERLEGERRWILDPFKFLAEALDLPAIPAPDVTTEGGRRIFTTHVDGDAFVSRAERAGAPFTAQLVLDEILKRWKIPHTVSIVEGEVGPTGQYPQYTSKLEAYARQIFALPYVEMASHTYSHPFEWEDAEAGRREPHIPHLPIKGYTFNLERDLKGSVDYINTLAPPGKRVKVMLWSGNCSPSAQAVGLTQRLGLFNVNGGGATRTKDLPSLTRGSAMGIPKAPGVYQVFAPVENENVYTNDWLGPFDGYRHAVETYQLNESPRRLSTLTIYYHFYSAAKTAAFVALKEVYAWAVQQETTPLYLSEYAAKVVAFQRVSLAKRSDGAWEIGNLGELRTVRLDSRLGWPHAEQSIGVAGVRDVPQGRYVHFTDARESGLVVLRTASAPSTQPRLVHANGRARTWNARPDGARIRVTGDMPLEIDVAAKNPCRLTVSGKPVKFTKEPPLPTGETVTSFELTVMDTGDAELDCK